MSRTPEKAATVILKFSEFNYQQVSFQWHLHLDHVGATGQEQIVSFYKLICRLYKTREIDCYDFEVPEQEWNNLLEGKLWPGSFSPTTMRNELKKRSNWADDLRDIKHAYDLEYSKLYGDWFIQTQDFIKEKLLQEKLVKQSC